MRSDPDVLNGVSILVVEDDADGPGVLSLALYKAGARIMSATTARAALRVLWRLEPDVVVSDISLIGAREILTEARKAGVRAPFIAVSGTDLDGACVSAEGFAAFLHKPVRHELLVNAVLALTR